MGLGKTVQSVAYLHYVFSQERMQGPFLIVAPLSTIPHWKREIEGWTDMNAIVYHGGQESRKVIRENEFFYPDGRRYPPKFHVNKYLNSFNILFLYIILFLGFNYDL